MTTDSPSAGQLVDLVDAFTGKHILCVGDVMLDRYVYGAVKRISPEAPIPVLAMESETAMLGAAGNVVRNIVAMGGSASLLGVVGDDEEGREILRLIQDEPNLEANLLTMRGRKTTVKTRYVAGAQQLLRTDSEDVTPLDQEHEDRMIRAFEAQVADCDAVVLSDYAKGVLSARALPVLIKLSKAANKPIIADPKNEDFSLYRGVTVLKPNAIETERATGIPCADNDHAVEAGRKSLAASGATALLITRSEKGMTLVSNDQPDGVHFRPQAAEVFDVSGAGDTSSAALTLALAAGGPFDAAAALANLAGSLAVAKMGTAVVLQEELSQALQAQALEGAEAKILSLPQTLEKVARWRSKGLRVGFTNGCFDLLHPGHVSLLTQARDQCDRLIVGLNTDASIKRLKGDDRPINPEMARAVVLASLETVSTVTLFTEDTPLKLIESIKPDVLIKGADYTVDTVVGSDVVQAYGGQVFLAKLKPGHSTTNTITKMNKTKAAS